MSITKRAVCAALTLLLTLTTLASVRPSVALAAEGHDREPTESTTTTGAEQPADQPSTDGLEQGDPAPEAQSAAPADDLVADTPADEAATPDVRTADANRVSRRDPRWIDFRNCPAGFWTCAIAKMHQDKGAYMWRNGKVFITHDARRVRGHRGHTWNAYRRQARQLVSFLKAIERAERVQARRATLVRRWSGVARCESGGRWSIATGNGYYGGLQFSLRTWRAYGGRGYPHQQPAWHQAEVAERLRVRSGLHHWPHCGRYYG